MWVAEAARGLGIAHRVLTELEAEASWGGATSTRLEPYGTRQEAIMNLPDVGLRGGGAGQRRALRAPLVGEVADGGLSGPAQT
jgi:hypothetical protein